MKLLSSVSRFFYENTGLVPFIVVLVVYLVYAIGFLASGAAEMNHLAGKEIRPLDLQFGYSADQAYATLNSYSNEALAYYVDFEKVTDVAYPILYSLMLVVGLSWGWKTRWENGPRALLNLLPLIAMLLDFFENAVILRMIGFLPTRYDHLARAASFITCAKWLVAGGAIFLMLMGFWLMVLERNKKA